MAITRVDTSIQLSDTGLPIVASNPLVAPILLSAVIPNGTNQVVATFNTPCSDSGGPLGSYTGDAILRECGVADLTIGVAATQAGDGTITYDVQELLTVGTVYGFTAGGAAFTTCTVPIGRFTFNGTAGVATAFVTANTDAGAITLNFKRPDLTNNNDLVGNDVLYIRSRGAGNDDIRPTFFSSAFNATDLSIAINTEYLVQITYPSGVLTGPTSVSLDGTLSTFTGSKGSGVNGIFYIGQSGLGNTITGELWDVKIYSDEAMTNLIHHWPMDEGSGTTFFDIVGGDDLTFNPSIGSWT